MAKFYQSSVIIVVFFILALLLSADSYEYSNWALTQANVKKVTFLWKIRNYSTIDNGVKKFLDSPPFPEKEADGSKWYLTVFPNGSRESGYLSLYLELLSDKAINATFTFSLLRNGVQEKLFGPTNYFFNGVTANWGTSKFISKQYIFDASRNYLVNDELTILVEIRTSDSISNISGGCLALQKMQLCNNFNNFSFLFENNRYSDMLFVLDNNVTFESHKAIVAAQSSVLSEKFDNEITKYNDRSEIRIENVDPYVFKEMLRFIYMAEVENLDQMAKDILPVANRYKVKNLMSVCGAVLCQNMNTTNAIETLLLADRCDDEDLKTQVTNFIAAHISSLINTPEFKQMKILKPHLALDILMKGFQDNKA